MSVQFNAEFTRKSTYLFLPEDIGINEKFNGRTDLPPIDDIVASFLKYGQRTPIEIRMGPNGKPMLDAGHTRWRAAIHINKKKLSPVPFKLECVYAKTNEIGGFINGIIENHHRNQCTPIDDANNIKILLNAGQTEQEVAAIYNKPIAWVRDRIRLLEVEPEVQRAVTEKRLKPSAVKHIAKLSAEAQRTAMARPGRITLKDVKPSRQVPVAPLTPTTDSYERAHGLPSLERSEPDPYDRESMKKTIRDLRACLSKLEVLPFATVIQGRVFDESGTVELAEVLREAKELCEATKVYA